MECRVLLAAPDVAWSTYLGGNDYDAGYNIAVDSQGNTLVTGETYSAGWAAGGFDTSYNGGYDAFVAKYDPNGQRLWVTYLGGAGDDAGWGIALDSLDNVLVTGWTQSAGWASGGFDTSHNGGSDAFVAKLTSAGQPVWSTYLGGTADDFASGIAVDNQNNVVIGGFTGSSGWTSVGFDTSYNGGTHDAFAAKLSATGQHLWSTYLGGSDNDEAYGIAVDSSRNVFITGETRSAGWTVGGFDTTHNGDYDIFVAKLDSAGQHAWSTYMGGANSDAGWDVATDNSGNVLVSGWSASSGWAAGGFDTTQNGDYDAFAAKLTNQGQSVWSTYLGGTSYDTGTGIAADGSGNVLVTGWTESSGWTSAGFNTIFNGGLDDAFVVRLSPQGQHLWSTYLGGTDTDEAYGIAVDSSGNALVAGDTFSSGWTANGFDTSYNGDYDGFVAKINVGLPPALTGNDVSGGDIYIVQLDDTGTYLDVYVDVPTSSAPTYHVLASLVGAFTINGRAGNDQLTIDSLHGDPLNLIGLTFNGKGGNDTLNITGGAFAFNADAAASSDHLTLNATNAVIAFNTTQHLAGLNIGDGSIATLAVGGDKILVTDALSVTGTGLLNLKDNDLLAKAGDLAAIRAAIGDGRIFTDSGPVGGKAVGLGYSKGDDPAIAGLAGNFDGEPFALSAVLIKFTYIGDGNLDGSVDGSDVALWAQNFSGALGANPANPRNWTQGDWNRDGSADGSDVALWAQNFTGALGGGGLSSGLPTQPSAAAIAPAALRTSDIAKTFSSPKRRPTATHKHKSRLVKPARSHAGQR